MKAWRAAAMEGTGTLYIPFVAPNLFVSLWLIQTHVIGVLFRLRILSLYNFNLRLSRRTVKDLTYIYYDAYIRILTNIIRRNRPFKSARN